ncbi:MAG: hypothetical protein M1830_002977 [Pleopsidium flavum]|nr:MAG: hypothetical protein M1830_002977 [Pleopsidium flavum]
MDTSWSEHSGSMSSTGVGTADVDEDHDHPTDSPLGGGYASSSLELRAPEDVNVKQGGTLRRGLALWARHRRLHQRHIVPNPGSAPSGAVKTVIESVLQVVVENSQSSIAALTLPTVPTVVSFPSYGQLTVPAVPTYPSFPPQTLPTVPAYPFTSAAPTTLRTTMPSTSNAVTSAPVIGPGRSSAYQGSNSSEMTSSSIHTPLTSTLSTPLSSSSVQSSASSLSSILSQKSQASSVPVFPLATAGGNFSRITFTSFDGSSTFTGTSTIDLNNISNSTSLTSSTASDISSSLHISVTSSSTTSSQSSSDTISTSSTISSSSSTRSSTSSFSGSSSIGSSSSGSGTGAGGLATATATGTGISNSPSGGAAGNGDNTGNSTAPPTPTVVGSVVGGVAGLAILAVLMLFLFRWYQRKKRYIPAPVTDDSEVVPPGTAQSGAMTQRSSNVPLAAAAIAPGFFKRLRPHSGQTIATTETAPSERGFQNLGGRKLPSVFSTGGNGYGGGYDKETLSGSSFYRDSQGFYGGPGSPSAPGFAGPSSGPSGHGLATGPDAGDKEVAVMRPSPARTPVTSQGGFGVLPGTPRGPSTPKGTPPPPIGTNPRDAIGRSRPSFNGSRGSRFTEETA